MELIYDKTQFEESDDFQIIYHADGRVEISRPAERRRMVEEEDRKRLERMLRFKYIADIQIAKSEGKRIPFEVEMGYMTMDQYEAIYGEIQKER